MGKVVEVVGIAAEMVQAVEPAVPKVVPVVATVEEVGVVLVVHVGVESVALMGHVILLGLGVGDGLDGGDRLSTGLVVVGLGGARFNRKNCPTKKPSSYPSRFQFDLEACLSYPFFEIFQYMKSRWKKT